MPGLVCPIFCASEMLVYRSEQGCRAVSHVVIRHRCAAALLHRQSRLGGIQSLNLALLIHRQRQRVFGRIEVESNDCFQLVCKLRVVAHLDTVDTMWFQAVGPRDAGHESLQYAHLPRHSARGPVRRAGRRALRSLCDQGRSHC